MRTLSLITLFFSVFPLLAQTSPTVAGPKLVAEVADNKQPIQLTDIDIALTIRGFLVETALTMRFTNTHHEVLEGELIVPLPTGATVSGYALDVGDVMIDGVVVPKDDARVALELEAWKDVDPGVVEQVAGNVYRTRVYPVPAFGSRQIRLSWVDQVSWRDGNSTYRLPLTDYPKLATFSISLDMDAPYRVSGIDGLHADQPVWRATQFQPKQDLVLKGKPKRALVASFDRASDGSGWFAMGNVPLPTPKTRPFRPRSLALYWDASLSRKDTDHGAAYDMISTVARTWHPDQIILVVLRNEAEEPVKFTLRGGRCPHLIDYLAALDYDGGTDLSPLNGDDRIDADAILFFGDAFHTTSKAPKLTPRHPFFAFTEGPANRSLLQRLAQETGGQVFDLRHEKPNAVMSTLAQVQLLKAMVTGDPGHFQDVFISPHPGRPQHVIVTGRQLKPGGVLLLGYQKGVRLTLPIQNKGAEAGGLARRYWAQRKVDHLSSFPEEHKPTIIALAQAHGLVTPYTSLMVFENVDQYVAYGIEPPASMPQWRELWQNDLAHRQEQLAKLKADRLKELKWDILGYPEPVAATQTPEPDPEPMTPNPVPDPVANQSLPLGNSGLVGRVTDEHEEVLPGTIVLVSQAGKGARRTVTNEDGLFQVHQIPPGTYQLTALMPGFQNYKGDFQVSATQIATVNIALRTSVLQESLVVSSHPVQEREAGGRLSVKPWNPDTPYMKPIRKAMSGKRYQAYLKQRELHGKSPGFYVDTALYFYQHNQPHLGRRVASNLLELGLNDDTLIRISAAIALTHGEHKEALNLYDKLVCLRPEWMQSYRDLALAYIMRGDARLARGKNKGAASDFRKALTILHDTILEPWGSLSPHLQLAFAEASRYNGVDQTMLMDLSRVRSKLRSLGIIIPDKELSDLAPLLPDTDHDLRVVLTWMNRDTDVDLSMEEPDGDEIGYGNRDGDTGAYLVEDNIDGLGPEEIRLPKVSEGAWTVSAQYYGYDGPTLMGPATLMLTIYRNHGRPNETVETSIYRLKDAEDEAILATLQVAGKPRAGTGI